MLGRKSPVGMKTLPMFTTSWSTLLPQIHFSTWSTTTLLASLSSSVRETWRSRSCRRGWYYGFLPGSLDFLHILYFSPFFLCKPFPRTCIPWCLRPPCMVPTCSLGAVQPFLTLIFFCPTIHMLMEQPVGAIYGSVSCQHAAVDWIIKQATLGSVDYLM